MSHSRQAFKKGAHLGARLSNSSKKRRQGFAAEALSKVLLTEASLSPMYLDKSSGPWKRKKLIINANFLNC